MRTTRNWRLWSGLIVLFLTGVMVGALGMGIYQKREFGRFLHGGPPAMKRLMIERFAAELNLSKEQRVEIDRIADEVQKELFELRTKHQPEIEAILLQGVSSMKTYLSPEQQKKLDLIFARKKERWERNRGAHPERDQLNPRIDRIHGHRRSETGLQRG